MRRMDRYDEQTRKPRRSEINQELYQDTSINPKYTNITDVTNTNAYEISNESNGTNTREAYQQMKRYQGVETQPKSKKDLDNLNYLYPKQERKVYDINSVLEDARKNRKEQDDLEEKRKLKYTSYNILAGVNLEELARYREEKKKRQATPEEEGIRELMDTIASKTLAGELDKETTVDLLSDLMATSAFDKVAPQKPEEVEEPEILMVQSTEEIVVKAPDTEQEEQEKVEEELEKTNEESDDETLEDSIEIMTSKTGEQTMDTDFFTKSMDLSDKDFSMSDEFQEKGLPLPLKIFSVLLFLAVVGVTIYFVLQRFK